ncbi:MAG: hypothetical protein H6696_21185 [Deferribacteres bacterium]|nr:hypothetical protein [candidate division KSB1 bacterium]MCB9504448.1 hypothetical protein [Deferribacteres bacterium]
MGHRIPNEQHGLGGLSATMTTREPDEKLSGDDGMTADNFYRRRKVYS